ncbi:MAG: AAA family ATPase [Clostridiales Family XIII bacterium]|jgi:predicted AAA+ superfamily ATPase|nr:AAA family ATPase [Clostridiales Family XIII bacterium]
MLKRKIYGDLIRWKNRDHKKVLVIEGARQVGKTFIVETFARENYKRQVLVNFAQSSRLAQAFSGELSVDHIISQLSVLIPDSEFGAGDTIIILDEIQLCPNAITSLKFFSMDGRFDVIATGSLLGINYKEVVLFPVGYIERLEMHSLDFEEFLLANKMKPTAIEDLRTYFETKKPVPEAIHERMLELFREYIVVGGMPAVVNEYVRTHHFGNVLKIQKDIVADYLYDIAKYADGAEKTKARECFLSIPNQLFRDYKKFRYAIVDKHGNARKYAGSLMWLLDAGIISFCNNLERIELPLEGNVIPDAFKVYMRDTGLLVSMLEEGSAADILAGDLGIYKGALYENIIADIFTKSGKKLYYYEYRSNIEMDFIIRYEGEATAVEVKSADHTKSKSMKSIMENYGVKKGIKLSSKNVGYSNNVTTYPLYMAIFL